MNTLLQQVRVLDPVSGTDKIADVLIADGIIKSVADQILDFPEHTLVQNCQGMVLAPGLVDLYSHSGEPGFEERETVESLMKAATAGGFTRLAILPNTLPPIDNLGGLAQLQQKIQGKENFSPSHQRERGEEGGERRVQSQENLSPSPHLYFWGALTMGVKGEQMTELAELADAGVVGFADGKPIQNLGLLRRMLEYLKSLGKPVALFPCNQQLAGNGVMREGFQSVCFGLPGNPAISESSALAAILEIVEATGTPVHIMRVSTSRGVELIQSAKQRGLPITASTTWIHLLLNTNAVSSYDPNLHLEPPLGNPDDQEALIWGVRNGVIDAIAIDHTPYTYEEKTVSFGEAPSGTIGLELALPLLWQNFVVTEKWSALELWRVLSVQPAQFLGQSLKAITLDVPAELILFDPDKTWNVTTQTLKSRSSNTSWLGQQITGQVVQIWNSFKG
ncbi:dihydroorotase, multifunctional complex type [Crinalium epipsammum PCC 9333]|uniref:Dihydroorotase, multifunctional complex type n=1 Tax=Crinalium epipsammum PCC 9333 TaxID=1173022 RepID=K9W004_9CYAN|nr:dihydroorotase [Crinalium epipsammum]AFZ13067.1 dihydroorotase, multifunctional complex type [Crinalium epipsammum PCC 9333]